MCILYGNRNSVPSSHRRLVNRYRAQGFQVCLGISLSPRAIGPGECGSAVKTLLYANTGDKFTVHTSHSSFQEITYSYIRDIVLVLLTLALKDYRAYLDYATLGKRVSYFTHLTC